MPLTDAAAFAYMQARIQARHGDRLTPEQWRQLDTSRDLGRYLQLARASGLDAWARHFDAREDPREWERSLRAEWSSYVESVAQWAPERWHESLSWLQSLPYLPAVEHLLRGEPPPSWARDDPFFAALDLAGPDAFRDSLAASEWSALPAAWRPERPVASWLAAWRTSWPATDPAITAELDRTCRELASAWDEAEPAHAEWLARLEARFTALLRRRSRTILALIGHIGLVSLDLIHLRAGLMRLHVAARTAGDRR